MASSRLEFQHHSRQLFYSCFHTFLSLADVEILAVLAAQVAVSEENRTRASPPSQWGFFAHVWEITADHRPHPSSANTELAGSPV
jgi:hypothetical protein